MGDTLRDYLVGLGFQVDEASWQKFTSRVERSARNVGELGAEAVATGFAISKMVERVARSYEELYYVSQRTGSGVGALKANEYGWRQIGLSAQQARQTVESVAASMRANPGMQALMRSFGLDPRDAEASTTGLVEKLKSRFGEKGYFAAAQYAGMFGIDEGTFRTLWMNIEKLRAKQAENRQMQREAGFDARRAADDFLILSNNIDKLTGRIGILFDRIAHDLGGSVNTLVRGADWAVRQFTAANDKTDGAIGVAGAIAASGLGVMIAKKILMRILGVGAGTAAAAAAAPAAPAAAGAAPVAAAAAGGMGLAAMMAKGPASLLKSFGVPVALLAAMKYDTDNSLRSQLRSLFGIEETEEDRRADPPWRKRDPWASPVPFSASLLPSGDGTAFQRTLAPTINQKTEINIAPGPNAFETARAVFGSQDSINANLVRYWGRQIGEVRP